MTLINLGVIIGLFLGLYYLKRKNLSFGKRILLSLLAGILVGLALQSVYGLDSGIIKDTVAWPNVFANAYIQLLKLTVTPFILISIISSILQL